MKTPRFILAGLCLATLLLNLLPLRLHAAPSKAEILIDFADVRTERTGEIIKSYEYAFDDWDKHVSDLPGRGALVQSKTNKGGLGEDKTMVKFDKTSLVDLVFMLGKANNAKSLNFSLVDKDGTEQQWNIPIEGLPKGQVQIVRMDLAKCTSEQKPGKIPGMNFKKIVKWEIKGDYSEPNIEVLLIKLVAPPI